MINIRFLGSKEDVEGKFKERICAKLRLKLWFESNWHFSNITKLGWFWNWLSERKVLSSHFLLSLQKQLLVDVLQNRWFQKFLNIHRNTSMLEFLFSRCFLVNIRKIRTTFFIEHFWWHLSIFFSQSKTLRDGLY